MKTVIDIFLKHPVELILIITAGIMTCTIIFLSSKEKTETPTVLAVDEKNQPEHTGQDSQTITIDVAGAVKKPDVYKVPGTVTLSEVIKIAGGFSAEADRAFIGRNFNLAKGVTDKEKIYIPTQEDIEKGMFVEKTNLIETGELQTETPSEPEQNLNGISINSATLEELDVLPGVGPVTAQKIIDNRPYNSAEELVSKKTLSRTNFEKIKDLISL